MKLRILACLVVMTLTLGAAAQDCGFQNNPFTNCGFETGDFTGWVTQDLAAPFWPVGVRPGGTTPGPYGLFSTAPTEGTFVASHGFDGIDPGVIVIAQDITIPANAVAANLRFSYRIGWDYTLGAPATLPRQFRVEVQPSGGGAALATIPIFTADPATLTQLDTGNLTGSADLSAFVGQAVRVAFVSEIPESQTGPGHLQIDAVGIAPGEQIPAVSPIGLALMLLLLGMVGFGVIRMQ